MAASFGTTIIRAPSFSIRSAAAGERSIRATWARASIPAETFRSTPAGTSTISSAAVRANSSAGRPRRRAATSSRSAARASRSRCDSGSSRAVRSGPAIVGSRPARAASSAAGSEGRTVVADCGGGATAGAAATAAVRSCGGGAGRGCPPNRPERVGRAGAEDMELSNDGSVPLPSARRPVSRVLTRPGSRPHASV